MKQNRRIQIGVILGAHGVQGAVRLRSFTEKPESIFGFKTVTDENGKRVFSFKRKSVAKDHFIVTLKGVADRNAAEALRGTKLFVERSALPRLKKREYYEADLVGLKVFDRAGKDFGNVLALHDYGAGVFLEIKPAKSASFMLPFTDVCVPEIDFEKGRITIVVPEGWLTQQKPSKTKGKT